MHVQVSVQAYASQHSHKNRTLHAHALHVCIANATEHATDECSCALEPLPMSVLGHEHTRIMTVLELVDHADIMLAERDPSIAHVFSVLKARFMCDHEVI